MIRSHRAVLYGLWSTCIERRASSVCIAIKDLCNRIPQTNLLAERMVVEEVKGDVLTCYG